MAKKDIIQELTLDPGIDQHIFPDGHSVTVVGGKVIVIKDVDREHIWSSACWCKPYLARNGSCINEGSIWLHRNK
jgi:hypothetical protein